MEKKNNWLADLAAPAAAIAGQGIGLLMQDGQDRRQIKQQKKLTDIQIAGNKQLSDYNQKLQMNMWKNTNFSAQLAEAKKAGMSVSALLGGAGTGGATTGGGASSVGAGSAADAASTASVNNGLGMQAAQLALMKAQKENIEADTANKTAGAGKANEEITGKAIENEIAGATKEKEKERITEEANLAFEKATMATVERQLQNQTQQDVRDGIKAEAIGKALTNRLIEANTGKTYQEIKKIKNDITQKWEEIAQGWEKVHQGWQGLDKQQQQIELEKFKRIIEANYPGLWNVLGRGIDDGIQQIMNLGGGRVINKKPSTVNEH